MQHTDVASRTLEIDERLLQLTERMESAMNATVHDDDAIGKTSTMVLDTGATPSFIKGGMKIPTKLTP